MPEYKYKTLADDPLSKVNDDEENTEQKEEMSESEKRIEVEWKKVFYFEHGYYPRDLKDGVRFLDSPKSFDDFMESYIPGFSKPKPLYENVSMMTNEPDIGLNRYGDGPLSNPLMLIEYKGEKVRVFDPNVKADFRQQTFHEMSVEEYKLIKETRYMTLNDIVKSITESCYNMMISHNITPNNVIDVIKTKEIEILENGIQKYSHNGISVYTDYEGQLLNVFRDKYYGTENEPVVESLMKLYVSEEQAELEKEFLKQINLNNKKS